MGGIWDFLNTNTNAGTYQGLAGGDGAFSTFGSGTADAPSNKSKILGMDPNQFSQIFGAMGNAIAPDTPMGRVGGVVSAFAKAKQDKLDKEQSKLAGYNREDKIRNLGYGREDKIRKLGYGREDEKETARVNREDKIRKLGYDREDARWASGEEARDVALDVSKARLSNYQEPAPDKRKLDAYMKANPDATAWEAEQAVAKMGEAIDSAVSGGQQQINELQKNRPKYIAMFMKQSMGEDENGEPVFPTYRQATEMYDFEIRRLKDAQAKAAEQRGGSEESPVKTERTNPPRDPQDSSSGTTTGGGVKRNKKPLGADFLKSNLGTYSGLRGAARLNEQYINKPLGNLWGASTQLGNQLIKGSKAAGDWLLRENE